MRTYRFELLSELDLIAADHFVDGQIEAAQADDATQFQKQLLQQLKDEGLDIDTDEGKDAFALRLLKNGLRVQLKHFLLGLAESSGLGARVAPVGVPVAEYVIPMDKEEPVGN